MKECSRRVRAVLKTELNAKKQTRGNQHASNTCRHL